MWSYAIASPAKVPDLSPAEAKTSGSIRNVLGYNLEAIGTSAVLRLKSAMNRGGTSKNIYMTEVKAEKRPSRAGGRLELEPQLQLQHFTQRV